MKERILLHLFDHNRFADAYEAPLEVTQTGIAEAVGTRDSHLAQYLKPLLSDGEMLERKSKIKEGPRRRKVYLLSVKGRHRVSSQRSFLLKETVPFRKADGEIEETALSRIYHEERRGSTLLQLLQELQSTGLITTVAEEAQTAAVVDFSHEAPNVERFYGRARELGEVLRSLEQFPLVVVTGLAGIGKSSLGSRVCEELRGKRSLFWRRVRPWDSAMDLALRVSAFLRAHGRGALQSYLTGPGVKELGRIEEILASDLDGLESLLVFDDVHTAAEAAIHFLTIIFDILKGQDRTSLLLLSRTVPEFYGRQEVTVEGSVAEFPLKGLDRASSDSLLTDAGIPEPLIDEIVKGSGGSPLFLKILAKSNPREVSREGWSTLATYIAEEIEPSVGQVERECLRIASLYEIPVPARALLLGEEGGMRAIVGLRRKGLLDELETGEVLLHDFLRGYFLQEMPFERREALVNKVVPWLIRQGEEAAVHREPLEAIAFIENALMVETDPRRKSSNLRLLGDLRVESDPAGALEAYREALKYSEDPADKAQIHGEISHVLFYLMRSKEVREEVEKGLQLLPSGPSVAASILQLRRAHLDVHEERFDEAWEVVERVQHWLPHLPESFLVFSWLRAVRGDLHTFDPDRENAELAFGDWIGSLEASEAMGPVERLRDVGSKTLYADVALAAYNLGRIDETLSYVEKALEVLGETGLRYLPLNLKARCLADLQGDYGSAEVIYHEAYRNLKGGPFRNRAFWYFRHLADLYWREGRVEEARESLDHFLSESGGQLRAESRIENLALMSRICVACGDSVSAESSLREAQGTAEEAQSDASDYYLGWAKAVFHAREGDVEKAEASFLRTLGLPTPRYRGSNSQELLASRAFRGELLLDYGRLLASTSREKRARAVLLEALEEFGRLGRRPLEQTAREAIQSLRST